MADLYTSVISDAIVDAPEVVNEEPPRWWSVSVTTSTNTPKEELLRDVITLWGKTPAILKERAKCLEPSDLFLGDRDISCHKPLCPHAACERQEPSGTH